MGIFELYHDDQGTKMNIKFSWKVKDASDTLILEKDEEDFEFDYTESNEDKIQYFYFPNNQSVKVLAGQKLHIGHKIEGAGRNNHS